MRRFIFSVVLALTALVVTMAPVLADSTGPAW
jgi:hypothetical protein